MRSLFLACLLTFVSGFSLSAEASSYYCKANGSDVCAVSRKTGQCTHSWSYSDGGDPMYSCRVYTGEISNRVNRNNYQCTGNHERACARSKKTGQCGHEWTSGDGGGSAMDQCRRWMNPEMGRVDRSNYVCSGDGSRVCARNKRTGQCGHEWTSGDGGDPWFSCRKWLGR